jgi:tetratricopeptide (TPR) repeat protein
VTLQNSGRFDEALDQYRFVDTAYARTEQSAQSYYRRGLLYEQHYLRYDSALAAYTRGRGEAPQAPVAALIARRADFLGSYFRLSREIADTDSMLRAALAPLPDSVAQMPDSLRALLPKPADPDTLRGRLAAKKSELAGLFYFGLGVNDSAEFWYRNILREHPSSPTVPRSLYTVAQIAGADSARGRRESDSLYTLIIDRYPETPFAAEAARLLGRPVPARAKDPAEARYWSAERVLRQGDVEAAIDSFRQVARTGGTSPFVPRAMYAVGLLYENMTPRADSAVENYRRLVAAYPTSQFAMLAKPKLDQLDALRKADTARDSIATTAPPVPGRDSLASPPQQPVRPPQDVPPAREPKPEDALPPPQEVKPDEGVYTKPPLHRNR